MFVYETLHMNTLLHAVVCFLSRVILRKLNLEQLSLFRKVEKCLKIVSKKNADITYLP